MSLHDELNDVKDLVGMVLSDRKEEKEKEERERRTVQLVCPYCGTSSRIVWEDGKLPSCASCGAVFRADDPQLVRLREAAERKAELELRAREQAALEAARTKRRIRRYIIIGIAVIVLLAALVFIANLIGGDVHIAGGGTFHFHIS